jgi:phenylacetate-CoA ligase
MKLSSQISKYSQDLLRHTIYLPGIKECCGLIANQLIFPVAERYEGRAISRNFAEIRSFSLLPRDQQKVYQQKKLSEIIDFANSEVPYYKSIYSQHHVSGEKIIKDINFINDFPILTKSIIREHGHRLLSKDLEATKHHACKTGGSTGPSCIIYYDQPAADRSAAVTRYARFIAGKRLHRSELHFACDFGESQQNNLWQRETLKCMAMNRSNIFVNKVDKAALQKIYNALRIRKPYLVHGHPSTMYQLALFVEQTKPKKRLFGVFEPSGEYCTAAMASKIKDTFGCKINNRYGLAEFGVVAYQIGESEECLRFFDSENFCELIPSQEEQELVITGFHNKLMPLIRYKTGDLAHSLGDTGGLNIHGLRGRTHDKLNFGDREVLTHFVQDIVDHRIGGVAIFQLNEKPIGVEFLVIEEDPNDKERIRTALLKYFPEIIGVKFVDWDDIERFGRHQKFRYLVNYD